MSEYERWMLRQWDEHARVQDRPVPCYVCSAPVGPADGWHRDGRAWCADHQPVWSHERFSALRRIG